jgi:hypothetical protein
LCVWQRILAEVLNERVGCHQASKTWCIGALSTLAKLTGYELSLAAGDDAPDSRASLMVPYLKAAIYRRCQKDLPPTAVVGSCGRFWNGESAYNRNCVAIPPS